jgi:hypothetical protein
VQKYENLIKKSILTHPCTNGCMKQTRFNDMEIYTINQDPYIPLHPRLGNQFICNITEVIYRHPD